MHLEEESVTAVQMMLQWIYTGNVTIPNYNDMSRTISAYLDFFTLADKVDLSGLLTTVIKKLGNFSKTSREYLPTFPCHDTSACATYNVGNNWDGMTWGIHGPCTCGAENRGWMAAHKATCELIYIDCSKKSAHLDSLRDNTITAEHLQAAFELQSGHEARKILVQACVSSYVLSVQLNFEFKFEKELDSLDGFGKLLLHEVAKMTAAGSHGSIKDPLTGEDVRLPSSPTIW